MEPTMKDIARAAGWLQDHLGRLNPTAGEVESLSWLIAAARDEDQRGYVRLCARVLAIEPDSPTTALAALKELQADLCRPAEATVVQEGQ